MAETESHIDTCDWIRRGRRQRSSSRTRTVEARGHGVMRRGRRGHSDDDERRWDSGEEKRHGGAAAHVGWQEALSSVGKRNRSRKKNGTPEGVATGDGDKGGGGGSGDGRRRVRRKKKRPPYIGEGPLVPAPVNARDEKTFSPGW